MSIRPFLFAFLLMAAPLQATTLQEAMVKAYKSNPVLKSAQAKLRAVDETVPLAKSAARPNLDLNANAGYNTTNVSGVQTDLKPRGFNVAVTQPIYKGGRIEAGIDAAEKRVLAARAEYHKAEQDLFLGVATAYLNVWRDQSVLKLNRKNEEVLRQELQAARDRLTVGEATRTDVAQAESRFSGASAARIEAEGNLAGSRANYVRVVGEEASELSPPRIDFALPKTLDEASSGAIEKNPVVIAAKYGADAAESDVEVAEGALLPEVNIEASAGKNWETSALAKGDVDTTQIAARLTMPLYRSGADYARTRAAKETANQKRIDIHDATDAARENAVRSWETLQASRAALTARRKQVEAAQLAFEGVKQESQVGTRTVLDRLNAEAEALQARVDMVRAERDQALAMFNVKAAIGALTPMHMGLPVEAYDPQGHYEAAKDAWIGTAVLDDESVALTPVSKEEVAGPDEQNKNPEERSAMPSVQTPEAIFIPAPSEQLPPLSPKKRKK